MERVLIRLSLVVSLAVSLTANAMAANPTWLGRLVAAWPPVALMLTIELVWRVKVEGAQSYVRIVAALVVALVAAVISYGHMHELARSLGESTMSAYLWPVSADGLAIVAILSEARSLKRKPVGKPKPSTSPSRGKEPANPPAVPRSVDPPKPAKQSGSRAEAERILASDPGISIADLMRQAGVSRSTAKRAKASASDNRVVQLRGVTNG